MMTVSATLNICGWLWLGTDALRRTSLPQMAQPNQQIVGNGDLKGDTAYFCLSAQTDLLHPVATAGLGIGQLDQTSLFAGVFGCLGAHALPPGGSPRGRHSPEAHSGLGSRLWVLGPDQKRRCPARPKAGVIPFQWTYLGLAM